MNAIEGVNLRTRIFSILACVLLLTSTLLVGISMILPNVEAGQLDHTNANVEFRYLTDFGRMLQTINWGTAQTAKDPQGGFGFAGLVVDHDGYQHTPGIEDIADSYKNAYPYASADDFKVDGEKGTRHISMIVDDGIMQKSIATFVNNGTGTGDPLDIRINQTAWTITGKDWAIIQWDVSNIKLPASDLTNFCLGYEIPFSQNGSRNGVGGDMYDGGDDIDGFDATYDTYWVRDNNTGIEIGVASAISSDPITHYYGEDYHAEYRNESNPDDQDPQYYKNFFANETWLYNRISAPNALATDGVTPGNVTTTVGWNGETIATGTSRTFTLIIAMNNTHNDMITAIQDAQSYYNNILTGYLLTEIKDSASGAAQIEVYNFGRAPTDPTDPSTLLSFEADGTPLTGTWSNNPIPTYGYSTFTVLAGTVDPEGGTITLFENAVQIDEVSYGQKGLAPDPLDSESTARQFDISTLSYTDLWLRDPTPTWDLENDVADTVPFVWIVINRVMFNPLNPQEGYVELRYNGFAQFNISGYKIVCDNKYIVPGGTILNSTNPYFVLPYSAMNAFFNNMDADGDNVYLYDASDNLIDMVGWSSQHTQGMFMSRSPEGAGTYQGYDDATSTAAGWAWDFAPNMIMTEFYAGPTYADIEIYNPRGGDKVPTLWTFDVGAGALTGTWSQDPVPAGGYSTLNVSAGTPGDEGDTISFSYNGTLLETVSYGTSGIAPDPLFGESTSRYFNATGSYYTDDWTREDTPTWDAQNDVPALNLSSFLVLTEVMFDPSVVPDGKYIVITNREPGWTWPETDYYLVADDVFQLTSTIGLGTGTRLIIRYGDYSPTSDNFFNSIDLTGDNVYLYGPNGELCDMVGWTTAHTQGMSVRRVPDGNGTQDGYDDTSSVAASWVFDSPLQVYITEISDSESIASQIEVYNSWYPDIDFGVGFELRDSTGGAIPGSWTTPIAGAGFYAVYAVTTGLDFDGDTIGLYQNGILAEEAGYGTYGVVPDPLQDESSQRYYEMGQYYPLWGRMWDTPNFGNDNNIPLANLSSTIVLNEVLFNPATPGDSFVELYLRWGMLNISGYKLVSDVEYIIPMGTELNVFDRFYYFTEAMDSVGFFSSLNVNGDNIYLYDDNGTFLDEVGWSTSHVAGESVCRVPNGNGTRNGFDDTSSYFAGWRFGCTPTIQLVKISMPKWEDEIKYGSFAGFIVYNLTITNKQQVEDSFDILISTLNGYPYVIMDETMSFIISELTLLPGESINITVIVTLPTVIPFIAWDNLTLVAQSQNSTLFRDEMLLGAYVSPFIWPDKWADPSQIYIEGTGHDEETTIHVNLTGMGSVVELIQPQDVVFCVDTSGSMDPFAIDIIKEGLTGYVDEMDDPDQGAVVTFGGSAVLMNPLTNDYTQLKNDIASIPGPAGGTDMVGALDLAIIELTTNNITGHIKVIILLTDGMPSPPQTPDDVRAMADLAATYGILIFTIGLEPAPGFGSLDEVLLKDVANITGGQYFYAPNAQELPGIYKLIAAYIGDIAGRDPFPFDGTPMVRDVLPPWIELVPLSFSIAPATNYVNSTGYRILEWNISSLGIGASWEVTFKVKSFDIGWLRTNDLDASRVYFVDYFDNVNFFLFPEVLIEVLPSAPIPPRLYIDIGADPNDILLSWDEPASPGTVNYLIYRSTTPDGFDFSTIWVDTLSDLDPLDPGGVAVGDRRSWNHTGANDGTNEQWYYCIRAVNNLVEVSHTSRTVGKWTKDFPDGVSTFSIPLEPIIPMMTDNYTTDMNADYVRYMDVGGATWIQHDNGMGSGTNNIVMEVGKGYEVKFTGATTYTFLGMPGSHIQYKQGTFAGFDPDNSAKSLDVINVNPAGDVTLIWDPASPGTTSYVVYRSTTRDGFDTGSATNIATTTVQFHIDYGNATAGTQYYYMVIPENVTGAEGASTYSIGVFTMDILAGYDTLGIPLQTGVTQSLDWYCGQISNSVGINYFIESDSRWGWHSTVMPSGAFDPNLIMTEGYQVSTSVGSKYTFVGR